MFLFLKDPAYNYGNNYAFANKLQEFDEPIEAFYRRKRAVKKDIWFLRLAKPILLVMPIVLLVNVFKGNIRFIVFLALSGLCLYLLFQAITASTVLKGTILALDEAINDYGRKHKQAMELKEEQRRKEEEKAREAQRAEELRRYRQTPEYKAEQARKDKEMWEMIKNGTVPSHIARATEPAPQRGPRVLSGSRTFFSRGTLSAEEMLETFVRNHQHDENFRVTSSTRTMQNGSVIQITYTYTEGKDY